MQDACSGRHNVQSAPTTASLKIGVSTTAHSSQIALNLYSMWQEVEKVFPFRGESGEKCLHATKVAADQTTRTTY